MWPRRPSRGRGSSDGPGSGSWSALAARRATRATRPCAAPIADSWRRSAAAGVDPSGLRDRPAGGRRRRGVGALGDPSAGGDGAADPLVPGRDRRRIPAPDRRLGRQRRAAVGRGQRDRAAARGRLDELRRGNAVVGGRRRHQRDRDGDRRQARGPGVRFRALQRGRPALDLRGGSGPRPRHRRGDRRDRPDRRDADRASALDGGRDGDGAGGRGAVALRDAQPRRADARALRRSAHDRLRPAGAGRAERSRDRLAADRLAAVRSRCGCRRTAARWSWRRAPRRSSSRSVTPTRSSCACCRRRRPRAPRRAAGCTSSCSGASVARRSSREHRWRCAGATRRS